MRGFFAALSLVVGVIGGIVLGIVVSGATGFAIAAVGIVLGIASCISIVTGDARWIVEALDALGDCVD